MQKLFLTLATIGCLNVPAYAQDVDSMAGAQAEKEAETHSMRDELNGLKSDINDSEQAMQNLQQKMAEQKKVKEFHLFAKEGELELCPGATVHALTYNGQSPGPTIRVAVGDAVRVVLHNQLQSPTSLYFQGLTLPYKVDGLPHKEAGLVQPGASYAYQFVANQIGTFWYHPQVINADQQAQGLSGVLIVEPREDKPYDRDYIFLLGQWHTPQAVTYFSVNGKSAPDTKPIEVNKGEKILLRVINTTGQVFPLSLTGHRFEIISINGSDPSEPHMLRDTVSVNPLDHMDLLFTADNPGVWSLSSGLINQTTNNGKFPGGIATVVRYQE
jgi:FtsP/CotA-like multicopper oxidase with cupredoxin domain